VKACGGGGWGTLLKTGIPPVRILVMWYRKSLNASRLVHGRNINSFPSNGVKSTKIAHFREFQIFPLGLALNTK